MHPLASESKIMEIVFASANKNKISEIKAILPQNLQILGLKDIGIHNEIPEPGTTIKENSYLKAAYVINYLKEKKNAAAVFADDSGLEVAALDNAPGVYSALYAGEPRSDEANNQKLLHAMKLCTDRRARFTTIITLIHKDQVHYFEGEIKGTIAYEPRGVTGFGYDPLFIPQGYRSTFAELGTDVKNNISHRALATARLAAFLKDVFK